jgi:hypothetical protein
LVERIAFGITNMARGMPWGDWNDQVVMLHPLRWCIAAHQPEGSREMLPRSYRLFFVGGDLKRRPTEPFVLE